jgi:hypothetical protein
MNCHDLAPEQQNIIVIAAATLREAEELVEFLRTLQCDGCGDSLDWILDRVTGCDSTITDYILESPGKCPNCRHAIVEKTLIEPAD